MLMPKRTKYRKPHRISYEGHAKGHTQLNLGDYGLVAKTGGYVNARQIEAARVAMSRFTKRGGQIYINIFPHLARTMKPLETRQGTGKGDVKEWAVVVKAGTVMFEIAGVPEATAREALRLASHKLSVTSKIIVREESGEANEN